MEEVVINRFQYHLLVTIMGVLLVVSMLLWGREAAQISLAKAQKSEMSQGQATTKKEICVLIDAGHGGVDPGKIGINGAMEKDINLEIAFLVKDYLEQNDVTVVMTRETKEGLYDENGENKKVQDMKRRIEIMRETAPTLAVSIHQNSYSSEEIKGAQVFYYTDSKEGKRLAECLQEQLKKKVDPKNTRQVKGNNHYYLLKKSQIPLVIAECGFLSNSEEAQKLCTQSYQKRVAWAIQMGILQYLRKTSL